MAKTNLEKSNDWELTHLIKIAHICEGRGKLSKMENIENLNEFDNIEIKGDEPDFNIQVTIRLIPLFIYTNKNNGKVRSASTSSTEGRINKEKASEEEHKVSIENIEKQDNQYNYVTIKHIKYPIWRYLRNTEVEIDKLKLKNRNVIEKLFGKEDREKPIKGWKSIEQLKKSIPDERALEEIN